MIKLKNFTFAAVICLILCLCALPFAWPKSIQEWAPGERIKKESPSQVLGQYEKKQKIDISAPLSLAQLIDIALKNNPQTKQAWQNTLVARSIKTQAQSKYFPSVSVQADLERDKEIATIPQDNVDAMRYGGSFQLTYLLLDFGGRSGAVEETAQRIVSADNQYRQAIQDVILSVMDAYYGYYSAASSLEAARQDVDNTGADYEAALQRYDVGLATRLDVLNAKSTYDEALYSLENAKGELKNAKANLAQAIGIAANDQLDIVEPEEKPPVDISEHDVDVLVSEALDKRPDLLSVKAELNAKIATIKQASSAMLPTLNASGSGGINQYHHYGDEKYKDHDREYSALLSVKWDIFDGFYNLAKKRQAQREANEQYYQLIKSIISASVDVWGRYYDYNTAVEKLNSSQTFYDTAEKSYELASEGYRVGLKSILDLLKAQSQFSDARKQLVDSRKGVFTALAQLVYATGSLDISAEKAIAGE